MIDAQKPDHISLSTLISRLREGRFVIPDFQRDFEWKPWDISDLMRSIFLDYYIGSLLLWKGEKKNFEALSCEKIYGYTGDQNSEYIVLDGQQRLTAMYYAFMAPEIPPPGRKNRYHYFLRVDRFMAEEYDDAFGYNWSKSWADSIRNRKQQFAQHIFPFSIIGADNFFSLPNWLQGYKEYWKKPMESKDFADERQHRNSSLCAENASKFAEHMQSLIQQYQISYIELDKQLGIDKICDIFTQINSKGVQLDTFDLINALLRPKHVHLKQMWRDAFPRLEFVNSTKMNTYILQVMSILKQGYCSAKYLYFLLPKQEKPIRSAEGVRGKEVLIGSKEEFIELWDRAVNAIEHAINLLQHPQEFGAISSRYLPYISIIPVFSAIQDYVRSLPANERLGAQSKVRYWYWASVFLNRYSGSVESTAARDFLDLKSWINDGSKEPDLIVEFKTRFRTLELRREVRSGTSVYNGIFNLLVIQGARDWMNGNVPHYDDLDDHHIVPTSKVRDIGAGDLAHSILNRTPLTVETGRKVIRDRMPNEYLPELIRENGEAATRDVLESHFISSATLDVLLRNPFTATDYNEFIVKRQETILDAIESLLIKDRMHLSPHLRELDERVEQVELDLRRTIETTLQGDLDRIPSHLRKKVDDRIRAAAKKNPSIDIDRYEQLRQWLDYCDLRELQEIILNKSLWKEFEDQFKSKEKLSTRFDQLAELRNCIRHSRSADEITKKEGEAAILWFELI